MMRWLAALVFLLAAPTAAFAEDMRLQTASGSYTPRITSWRDLPFRTVVRQQHDFSCGSAALATLLTYHYDRPISEAEAFAAMYEAGDQNRIRTRGFSLLDMQTYLAAHGVTADGYRLSLDRIERMNAPAITMISTGGYRHFVVIKGFRGDQILVGDPAAGLRIYDRADFEQIWSGVSFMVHSEDMRGQFNRRDEWESRGITSPANVAPILARDSFTRDLPPLYQISPVVILLQ